MIPTVAVMAPVRIVKNAIIGCASITVNNPFITPRAMFVNVMSPVSIPNAKFNKYVSAVVAASFLFVFVIIIFNAVNPRATAVIFNIV